MRPWESYVVNVTNDNIHIHTVHFKVCGWWFKKKNNKKVSYDHQGCIYL